MVFSQEAKKLLFSFLANLRQKVKLNGIFSDCKILNHGVPQGTVLAPLIFLLYVNDFSSNISTTQKVIQFAEDTGIFFCGQKGKSLVLSHLSFTVIFFQNLSAKNLKRLNRQINWGIKVCFLRKKYDTARDLLIQTKTLPSELIIAKMSLIKFHYDIARPENSENFHGYLSLHQNTQTIQNWTKCQNQLWNEFDCSSMRSKME